MSLPLFTAVQSFKAPNKSYKGTAAGDFLPVPVTVGDLECFTSGGIATLYCLSCWLGRGDCVQV